MLCIPAKQHPLQVFPKAIDRFEPRSFQCRQLLLEVGGEWASSHLGGRTVRPSHHGTDIFACTSLTLAACRRHTSIPLLQLGGWGVEQIQVQKDTARLQMLPDLAVDLANTREVPEIVQSAGRHGGIKRAKQLR